MKLNDYLERAMEEGTKKENRAKNLEKARSRKKKQNITGTKKENRAKNLAKAKSREMGEAVLKEDVIRDIDGLFDSYESLIQKLTRVDKRAAKKVTDAWKKFITIVNVTVKEGEFRSKGLMFGKHLR